MNDNLEKIQHVNQKIDQLALPLERDVFLRTLLRHLAGSLEDVVGLDEASGFISLVGQNMGEEMNANYTQALGVDHLSKEQIGQVCVDLKRRIQGDFFIIEQDAEKIVFGNNRCPFAEKVLDRPSLCMMTSNVFGVIAAENAGYSRVEINKAIARHDKQCVVTIFFQPAAGEHEGREYFRASI